MIPSMSGLKAVVARALEASRLRERLLAEQARQVSQIAGTLLEVAQAQRSLHLLGEGTVAPLAEYFAARFRGDGEGLLIPARALPRDLDARSLLAFGQPSDGLLVLSLEGASRLTPLLRQARSQGVQVVGLLGREAAGLAGACDAAVILPAAELSVASEILLSVGHVLCGLVSQGLGQLQPVPGAGAPPPATEHARGSAEHDRPVIHQDSQLGDIDDMTLRPDSGDGALLADAVEAGGAPPTNPHGVTRRRSEPDPATTRSGSRDGERFRFRCGACEMVISVDPQHCGRRGRCPHCNAEFRIPQAHARSDEHARPIRQVSEESVGLPRGSRSSSERKRLPADERSQSRSKTRRRRRSTRRERRRAPRVSVTDAVVRVDLEGYPEVGAYHEPHGLDDLSMTGLRFTGPKRRYEVGEVVFLSIDFPAFPLPVRVKGEIRRVVPLEEADGFGTGVRFLEYVGDAENQIKRLLEGDQLRTVRRR